jgi:hypothetical protein
MVPKGAVRIEAGAGWNAGRQQSFANGVLENVGQDFGER